MRCLEALAKGVTRTCGAFFHSAPSSSFQTSSRYLLRKSHDEAEGTGRHSQASRHFGPHVTQSAASSKRELPSLHQHVCTLLQPWRDHPALVLHSEAHADGFWLSQAFLGLEERSEVVSQARRAQCEAGAYRGSAAAHASPQPHSASETFWMQARDVSGAPEPLASVRLHQFHVVKGPDHWLELMLARCTDLKPALKPARHA